MAEFFTVEVDATGVLQALDRLGARAEAYVLDAARATGRRIQSDARARVRRRTGTLAAAIAVEDAPAPLGGVRVFVGPMDDHAMNYRWGLGARPANFAGWHEFGTKKMAAQPFMFNSARLEEGPHLRRVSAALQEAITAEGLGD